MYPKWKYQLEDATGTLRATLVGNAQAEADLGNAWVDDPKTFGIDVVPCGGPWDAEGRVAFGRRPAVEGVTVAKIGG